MIFTWKHFSKDTICWILFLHHCILDRVSGGLSSDSGFWLQGCVTLGKWIHFSDFIIIKQREYPRSFSATTVSGLFPQAGRYKTGSPLSEGASSQHRQNTLPVGRRATHVDRSWICYLNCNKKRKSEIQTILKANNCEKMSFEEAETWA